MASSCADLLNNVSECNGNPKCKLLRRDHPHLPEGHNLCCDAEANPNYTESEGGRERDTKFARRHFGREDAIPLNSKQVSNETDCVQKGVSLVAAKKKRKDEEDRAAKAALEEAAKKEAEDLAGRKYHKFPPFLDRGIHGGKKYRKSHKRKSRKPKRKSRKPKRKSRKHKRRN